MIFKIEGEPPRTTAQMKGVYVYRGKPIIYEKDEVKKARQWFQWNLYKHRPPEPMTGAICLRTVWIFSKGKSHKEGQYKTTRPDTDNLVKLFKDVMTQCGYWKDDAQVADEQIVKVWGSDPGIMVEVVELKQGRRKGDAKESQADAGTV